MKRRSLRVTWAWLWTVSALGLLALGAGVIMAIALTTSDSDDVALAVALIGFPAVLGAFALGTLAVVMARPAGARWRTWRRWGLALVGAVLLLSGLTALGWGTQGAVLLILAGLSALSFLVMDVRRGREGPS